MLTICGLCGGGGGGFGVERAKKKYIYTADLNIPLPPGEQNKERH